MITEFVITSGETPKRLDVFLCHRERNISRTRIRRLIELGRIRLNAVMAKPSHIVKPGDHITMDTPQPQPLTREGKEVPLEILHEDDQLLVINKPAGIVVHPTSGNWSGTLLNAILAHLQPGQDKSKNHSKVRFVHRLDKSTSGIMVIAKTSEAHRALGIQFEYHTITRIYEALVWGIPNTYSGVIELPIGRDRQNGTWVSAQTEEPKHAITEYRVMQTYGERASRVQLLPQTGRTHQLRVHMASIGCPILGDTMYGGEMVNQIDEIKFPRVMLHARTLGFQHPMSGSFEEYSAAPPSTMQTICQAWKHQA